MKYIKKFESFDMDKFSELNEARVVGFDNENEGNFVVISGGPGAGKSFATGNLLNLRNFKLVNVDTYRESMARKLGLDLGNPDDNMKILQMTHTTSDPRNKTVRHLKNFLSIPKDHKPNIVFDAGGGQTEVMKTVNQLAKSIGYTTTLVYVKTDLDIALDRNRQRERTLKDEMVVDYHKLVSQSIDQLREVFDNVWEVNNSELWDHNDRPTDRIEKTK